MNIEKSMVATHNSNMKGLYRVGGISAFALGISYIVITVLYAICGALPNGAEEWLKYLARHTVEWWGILDLSVLTDFLFLPVIWALYNSLKYFSRNTILAGVGLVALFVILDLTVTWTNYSCLITLSSKFITEINIEQKMTYIAAANYVCAILSSHLFAVYTILVPSLGILIIGVVMLKGGFGKVTGYLGVATGILGSISVIGPFFITELGMTAILTSVITNVWIFLVGFKLLKLSSSPSM